jgi:hypothetical protein
MADPALPPDFSEFLRLLNARAAGRHQDLADLDHLP